MPRFAMALISWPVLLRSGSSPGFSIPYVMRKQGNSRVGFVPFLLILIVLGLGEFAGQTYAQSPEADDFSPSVSGYPVWSIAHQPDGKVLVGGWSGIEAQSNPARLNANGTLDSGFRAVLGGRGIPELTVYAIAVQPDGKIVIGGAFAFVNGQPRTNIARLNLDGTLDMSFYPAAAGETWNYVSSLLLESNGKIVLAGQFGALNGEPRNGLGRLNADGTLDTGFNPGSYASGYELGIQADGKIICFGPGAAQSGRHTRPELQPATSLRSVCGVGAS